MRKTYTDISEKSRFKQGSFGFCGERMGSNQTFLGMEGGNCMKGRPKNLQIISRGSYMLTLSDTMGSARMLRQTSVTGLEHHNDWMVDLC